MHFVDPSVFKVQAQTPFDISEENLFQRKLNLNAHTSNALKDLIKEKLQNSMMSEDRLIKKKKEEIMNKLQTVFAKSLNIDESPYKYEKLY